MDLSNTPANNVGHDDDPCHNESSNPHFADIAAGITRRTTLKTGWGATMAAMMGASSLSAFASAPAAGSAANPAAKKPKLDKWREYNFEAVAKNKLDAVTVPAGYRVSVVHALGDPIRFGYAPWKNDGSETAESYEHRIGCGHDGMHFFGMDENGRHGCNSSARGLLCVNHEYVVSPYVLHPTGRTAGSVRVASEVDKEIKAHGVSVVELKNKKGEMALVRGSRFNRRITSDTAMRVAGPAAGHAKLRTKLSPTGKEAFGTNNNCANGYTPWGTYLTCEENFTNVISRTAGDDVKRSAAENVGLARYGMTPGRVSPYAWDTAGSSDTYARWNTAVRADAAEQDFRNVFNSFGWVVEIDPFAPNSRPVKRTAMGRFAHENAALAPVVAGQPLVWYLGDDSRNEYIYKYVSKAVWNPLDATGGLKAGNKYLDEGTLYVAKFAADGTGQWMELTHGKNGLDASNAAYPFADQADVLIHARLAGDAVGATKMDRPEWAAVHPKNGEVYFTLTNNSNRIAPGAPITSSSQLYPDAANPRYYEDSFTNPDGSTKTNKGNPNGHIIRWAEQGGQGALSFRWDIYLFGAQADAAADVNLSGLTDSNDFSSPDGLAFDPRGLLWIQTDDGAYTDTTNCMLLAAWPGRVGDGEAVTAASGTPTFRGRPAGHRNLRRFLVGPKECEVTGIAMTPDGKTLFVNIQHPGEDTPPDWANGVFGSHFPDNLSQSSSKARPRSATLAITKDDGGEIALS